jgi:hypothetical protein
MGYTHHWQRPATIPEDIFTALAADMQRVAGLAEVPLADSWGKPGSRPLFGGDLARGGLIAFNGVDWSQPIPQRLQGLLIPPPPKTDPYHAELAAIVDVADDSHESFSWPRRQPREAWQTGPAGRADAFCKTARKPYDVVVVACLLVAKHHLGAEVELASDGCFEAARDEQPYADGWQDGVRLFLAAFPDRQAAVEAARADVDADCRQHAAAA